MSITIKTQVIRFGSGPNWTKFLRLVMFPAVIPAIIPRQIPAVFSGDKCHMINITLILQFPLDKG